MTTTGEDLLKRITTRQTLQRQADHPGHADLRRARPEPVEPGSLHEELKDDYPDLEKEDILACIAYAHAVIAGDSLAQVSVG